MTPLEGRLIFAVDDDGQPLKIIERGLTAAGYSVRTFKSAREAIKQAATDEPELIISGFMMKEVGGFDFREAYSQHFPHRVTPFLFLATLTDAANLMRDLDLGDDEYITKPFNTDVLKARVTAMLRKKDAQSVPIFRGDLSRMPFIKLLQFCEVKELSGTVELISGELYAKIRFSDGNLIIGNLDDGMLEKLYEKTEGIFVIYSSPMDLSDIADVALEGGPVAPVTETQAAKFIIEEAPESAKAEPAAQAPQAPQSPAAPKPPQSPAAPQAPRSPSKPAPVQPAVSSAATKAVLSRDEKPMGRLSGVQADNSLFQLQTEYITYPQSQIVTIVVHSGRVIKKHSSDIHESQLSKATLQRMIEEQHQLVEHDVREKVNELMKRKRTEVEKVV